MKSTDHTWLAPVGSSSGWRAPERFRPRLAAQSQLLFHVQPVDPFVVRSPAFAQQQHLQPPVAEPPPDLGQLAQPGRQTWIFAAPSSIAAAGPMHFDQPAGASLAYPHLHLHNQHCLS
jgi:hypothetical protein